MRVKNEQGITVIALIITVILLVILSLITINRLNENDGTIVQAIDSVNTHNVENYKQQISQRLEVSIEEHIIVGDEITLSKIASKMNSEEWVESTTVGNDILVKTKEGYVYEIFYDEEYGERHVEYLGVYDGNSFPTITASYDKATRVISVTSSEAQKIELSYNEEVIKSQSSTSLTYTANKTGWYKVKAKTIQGKIRYSWIRAVVEDLEVKFEVTSNGERENGWYGKDNIPVQVTITGNGSKLYYKFNVAENYTEFVGTTTNVMINTLGKTIVYAYTVDAGGNESEINSISIYFDNVKPTLGEITGVGEVYENNVYLTDVTVELRNALDENSGIEGYYWWLESGDDNSVNYAKGNNKRIIVKTNGRKDIYIRAKDKAGNLSDISTVSVEKMKYVTSITLNKDATTIRVGDTDNLIATITPDDATYKTVTWSSSDTSIATVSETGVVTGISVGTATITATAMDGSGISASCTVTVYNPNFVISFDRQGGTGGTDTVNALYGEAMPEIEVPTRSGYYAFDGYFDDEETKYYNKDGTSARDWDKNEDTTLYAHWSSTIEYGGTDGYERTTSTIEL